MSGPKRSIKITDHFTCTSANVICCITSFHCKKKIYIGETGRRLADRFRGHLRERNDKDVSKPVARHRLLPTFTSDLREKIRTRASFTNQTFNLCDIVNMFPCWPLCRCNFYNQQRLQFGGQLAQKNRHPSWNSTLQDHNMIKFVSV